ncbi:hypothetical protein BJ165DRAFT_1616530 [Panaeolus papilionaceus]|nr:hypothetical protein BJ165DRAFT_1616530 [Panaeolus papilionaceus]
MKLAISSIVTLAFIVGVSSAPVPDVIDPITVTRITPTFTFPIPYPTTRYTLPPIPTTRSTVPPVPTTRPTYSGPIPTTRSTFSPIPITRPTSLPNPIPTTRTTVPTPVPTTRTRSVSLPPIITPA